MYVTPPSYDIARHFYNDVLCNNAGALSTTATIKCWGGNSYGQVPSHHAFPSDLVLSTFNYVQLGYGDTVTRGDGDGEMGEALPLVDVGTDFAVTGISHAYRGYFLHNSSTVI